MPWSPSLEGTKELAEDLAGIARHAEEVASRPIVQPAVCQSVDVEQNTATVTLLTEPFSTISGLSGARLGVLPHPGRITWLVMNGAEPMLYSPIDGTMSVGGTLSSPTPDPKTDGWFIDANGDVWFNNATLRGNLVLSDEELFSNTTFESGVSPWTGANVSQSSAQAHSGTFSMAIANAGSQATSEAITVTGESVYRLLAWLYIDSINPDLATPAFLDWYSDAAATALIQTDDVLLHHGVAGAWVECVAAAEAPTTAVRLKVRIECPGSSTSITAFVDDVSLREANLVVGAYMVDPVANRLTVEGDLHLQPWQDYTPTITASTTSPTLGLGGGTAGRFTRLGSLVIANVSVRFGTSGTNAGSGTYVISLPGRLREQQAFEALAVGHGRLLDNSASTYYVVEAARGTADTNVVLRLNATAGAVAHNVPFSWAASDQINLQLMYEGI